MTTKEKKQKLKIKRIPRVIKVSSVLLDIIKAAGSSKEALWEQLEIRLAHNLPLFNNDDDSIIKASKFEKDLPIRIAMTPVLAKKLKEIFGGKRIPTNRAFNRLIDEFFTATVSLKKAPPIITKKKKKK